MIFTAYKGGHRSKRYRRIWPHQGKRLLLASFAEVAGHSFNKACQLQGHVVSGWKTKMLVSYQPALAYFI
jgi:hypothetical protein